MTAMDKPSLLVGGQRFAIQEKCASQSPSEIFREIKNLRNHQPISCIWSINMVIDGDYPQLYCLYLYSICVINYFDNIPTASRQPKLYARATDFCLYTDPSANTVELKEGRTVRTWCHCIHTSPCPSERQQTFAAASHPPGTTAEQTSP